MTANVPWRLRDVRPFSGNCRQSFSMEIEMNISIASNEVVTRTPEDEAMDMKLEVIVVPVSDVERSKRFYAQLGWRLDADVDRSDGFRVIQFTPPGSGASVIFGRQITSAVPGSVEGLHLVVADIE